MQSQWFVIHTLSGQEQKVKENIEKRLKTEEMGEYVKEVLVPMERVAEVRSGKKTVTMRKLRGTSSVIPPASSVLSAANGPCR